MVKRRSSPVVARIPRGVPAAAAVVAGISNNGMVDNMTQRGRWWHGCGGDDVSGGRCCDRAEDTVGDLDDGGRVG